MLMRNRPDELCLPLLMINKPDKIHNIRQVVIAGIDCTVERKNTRRLHIYVKPPYGEVLVTAPLLYTEREIKSFVTSKADWIRKHQDRMRQRSLQARMALEYVTGDILYFWGKPYELTVMEDGSVRRGKLLLDPEPVFEVSDAGLIGFRKAGSMSFDMDTRGKIPAGNDNRCSGHAELIVPPGSTREQREQLVKKKYKELLEKEAGRVLVFWEGQTGLKYSEWHSRYMKTRWGSLSVKNRRVCLNTRLAEKPEACLVYVALHEIAHIEEANHGPRFKAILNRYMPDWREAERMLKN